MDAKDILGLPKTPLAITQEKKTRPQRDSQRKPDGIAREVYALTGGLAPLMPSIDASELKRRPPSSEKITWQWLPFPRSALKDNLQLYHWVRVVNGVPPAGDYSFAKYNKEPYNVSQETERKRALSMVLSQTRHQERKDAEVLAEAKRITESRMAARVAEEPNLPVTLDICPESTERDIVLGDTISPPNVQVPSAAVASSTTMMADNTSTLASLRMLWVHLRTYALEQMVQAASSSAGLRTIKRVEQALQDLGVDLKPKVPTKAVCAEHLELRKEILTLLNLQKQLQYKEAEGSSFHDSSYVDMPVTPKKSYLAVDQDRTFVPDTISFGGDRLGKREQKRKGPGRASETPSSPAHKRPRKLKASDL
ncbi:SWR1-complex protein 4-like isoform X9 [Durio zibethinus]|uniref:SWR1-complex protein 4-like isoform X9 n=1 Tax=Durio zibethinus TaxID=66656 RepID=A0A6P5ZZ51_DURZI|nr:SWR1-complex protein 4-like isoform X9 [Durio zibethinus]